MSPSPSIFALTPQEHASAMEESIKLTGEVFLSPPPPGFVRVQMYLDMSGVKQDKVDCQADFPLEYSGDLDLRRVNERWGMDTCSVIEPRTLDPFEPSNPEKLSALAVKLLTEDCNLLRVIETSVTPRTIWNRRFRRLAFHISAVVINRVQIMNFHLWKDPDLNYPEHGKEKVQDEKCFYDGIGKYILPVRLRAFSKPPERLELWPNYQDDRARFKQYVGDRALFINNFIRDVPRVARAKYAYIRSHYEINYAGLARLSLFIFILVTLLTWVVVSR